MSKKNQHVVPNPDGGWGVKGSGNDKFTKLFDRKSDAVEYAREVSRNQNSELIVHGKNGQIQSKDSHGNDPFPPKG
ncbi:MAG TPA: DUF2188 domain-containing protein [Ignavibacteria bacterium]|nr:DUF2188 domain-containing protein [Ignavibacteria bacterium]HRK00721.1 DUF2188 domain-containing protein [Ignavibacteria bacterium]